MKDYLKNLKKFRLDEHNDTLQFRYNWFFLLIANIANNSFVWPTITDVWYGNFHFRIIPIKNVIKEKGFFYGLLASIT